MKLVMKEGLLILVPQTEEERASVGEWKQAHAEHVLRARGDDREALTLCDLGRPEVAAMSRCGSDPST